jgi:hypothetical protein
VTYAPEHERELPNRSYRRRMGDPRAPRSGSQKAGTTQDPQPTRYPRRRLLLRPEERLPLAALISGLRTPWETVYWWFGRWRTDGTFERLNAALRERLRSRLGREPLPSAGIADSQTTKRGTGVGGEQRGYDGNKKVRGRFRPLLVDTEGLVLKALPYTARRYRTRMG